MSIRHHAFQLVGKTLALVVVVTATGHSEEAKEPFYTQVSRMVVRLQHSEEVKREGQDKPLRSITPDGTAFFVKAFDRLFVITARHVAEKNYDLHAPVPARTTATGDTTLVQLRLPRRRWVFHPNGGDSQTHAVDVAVMRIPAMRDHGIVNFQYCPDKCDEGNNQLGEDPQPPALVLVFGFPLNIGFTLREPRPMARQGIVALVADEAFLKVNYRDGKPSKYASKGVYLVDTEMFRGNSGSPVLTMPPFGTLGLLGLVSASNTSLDYGVVVPVSDIITTLRKAKDTDIEGFHPWKELP